MTKTESLELLRRGALGNTLRTWESFEHLLFDGYQGPLTIRSRVPGSTECYFKVPYWTVLSRASVFWDPTRYYFNESAPDEHLVLQGEVTRETWGLELKYSTKPGLVMREAMRDAQWARGLVADMLLRAHLDASSYDALMELLDTYPNHVVEFSTYSRALGAIPGRNTVVWECRDY